MKTIGLIGGMSWESTLPYYRLLNEGVQARLGGLHSAQIVLYSVDFHPIEQLQRAGDWDTAGALLADAARRVQAAGADLLVLCTNTMHKVAPQMEAAVTIPLLHIADATAAAITAAIAPSACWARASRWNRTSTASACTTGTACRSWCRMRTSAPACTR